MQIILSILQFVSIALLVLLGIVLFLFLLILFYPICYTLEGKLYSEKNAKAKVSWLFHLIRARVVYEDDVIFAKIGVFWKNIPFSYELSSQEQSENEAQADMDNWMDRADWENSEEAEEEILWEESSQENLTEKEYDRAESANIDLCEDFEKSEELQEVVEEKDLINTTKKNKMIKNDVLNEEISEKLEDNRNFDTEHSVKSENALENLVEEEYKVFELQEKETKQAEISTNNRTKDEENSFDNPTRKEETTSSKNMEEKKMEVSEAEEEGKQEETSSQKSSEKQNKETSENMEQNTDDFEETEEEKINFIEKIKGMISKIKGTINKITQIWNEIKAIITDEANQLAVKHIKDEGIYLVKIFLPKKTKIDGIFSTGSPHTTGQVFGLICTFPILYQNGWSLQPDFMANKAYFQGSFYAKGRIYLYKMVVSVIRILLDKNCRRLYKRIKRFMDSRESSKR